MSEKEGLRGEVVLLQRGEEAAVGGLPGSEEGREAKPLVPGKRVIAGEPGRLVGKQGGDEEAG